MKIAIITFYNSKYFKVFTLVLSIFTMLITALFSFKFHYFLRFGYIGIFIFNAIGGVGTILVPILSRRYNIFLLAAVTSLGMAVFDSLAYFVGSNSKDLVNHSEKSKRVQVIIEKYGFWGLLVWSVIPFPYDFVGLAAGFIGFSYGQFLLAALVGKFFRFVLLGSGVNLLFRYH